MDASSYREGLISSVRGQVRYRHYPCPGALSAQGAELVGRLSSHCSVLLIHGTADEVLHVSNSEYLAALANQPKELLLCEGAPAWIGGSRSSRAPACQPVATAESPSAGPAGIF